MRMEEKEIYGQLYKIVEQNMNASGEQMAFSEQIFLGSVGEKKGIADILHFWDSDKQTFLANMYLQLFRRFPEDYAYERWNKDQREDKEVKKSIVQALVSSEEFRVKQALIKNNIITESEPQPQYNKEVIYFKSRMISLLMPIAKKLPNKVKMRIKKYLKMV